jgi:hypothetical protein
MDVDNLVNYAFIVEIQVVFNAEAQAGESRMSD